jgi:hypothetical protein
MRGLPVNVVNLICEWAAQEDIDWYPFFCPKTHNLSWKVNKYSKKFIDRGNIILHNRLDSYMIEGRIDIHDGLAGDYNLEWRGIMFQYIDGSFDLYIEVDTETDVSKKDKYIFRIMMSFDTSVDGWQTLSKSSKDNYDLFLNGTNYGYVYDGWFNHGYYNNQGENKIVLFSERY